METHISKSKNLDAKSLYENRVKGRTILLENPVRESRFKRKREEKKKQHQKDVERRRLKLISKKEAKLKSLWTLEDNQKKYVIITVLQTDIKTVLS